MCQWNAWSYLLSLTTQYKRLMFENGMTFDGSTTDPMQQAVLDALIAFMAATAQAQAEATKSAQRAGIDHKRRAQPKRIPGTQAVL